MTQTNEQAIVNSGTKTLREQVSQFICSRFGAAVVEEVEFRGEQQIRVTPESVYGICEALLDSEELGVKYLADITCVDWFEHEEAGRGRFEVVYNFCSFRHKYRFFLKTRLPEENPHIRSLVDLWHGANWMEREVFDLFGIIFDGHPDLRKILTADDLEGHPLRKDFPLTWEQPKFSWNQNEPPEVIR